MTRRMLGIGALCLLALGPRSAAAEAAKARCHRVHIEPATTSGIEREKLEQELTSRGFKLVPASDAIFVLTLQTQAHPPKAITKYRERGTFTASATLKACHEAGV